MNDVVITAALRTAVGKFNGSIAKVAAAELGRANHQGAAGALRGAGQIRSLK